MNSGRSRTIADRTHDDLADSGVELEDLIDALSAPEAYPQHVGAVQVLQTHISVLFFAGDRVYKLKKPVKLDFLDYTDLEERRRFCEEEVRLNRRISPKMYQGTLPVTRETNGEILLDGGGEVVDWVVVMVRLPAERMLDALLERGAIDESVLHRVAVILARFHDRAVTGPSVNEFGLATRVAAEVEENLEQLAAVSDRHPGVLSPAAIRFLRERARRFPAEHRALLERRVAQWRIREGHGDLHAGNICLVGDEVYVYDCVEFDRGLRSGDVASDLAFLAMDLDHRGRARASDELVRAYARITHDQELERLVPFYKTYRALIRAKVELVTAEDDAIADEDRRAALEEARRYGHLGVGYELSPCSILLGGASVAARSEVARYISGRLRASLLGGDGDEGAQEGNGAQPRILDRAVESLRGGRSVVVDADASPRMSERSFLDAATRLRVPCLVLALSGSGPEPTYDLPESSILRRSATATPEEHCEALQARLITLREP